MITGPDISRYQPAWTPAPTDDFVFVKASEGRTVANPVHDQQVALARSAGLNVGHYHWLWPGNIDAQLDWFFAKAKLRNGDIIALDWENDPSNEKNAQVPAADMEAWARTAQQRWPRNRVLVYTFPFYAPFQATKGEVYLADGLWIADYRSSTPDDIFDLPWLIHQYTSKPIDQNRARFDSREAMRAWATFQEDDMPLTDDDLLKIRTIVQEELDEILPEIWRSAKVDILKAPTDENPANKWTPASMLEAIHNRVKSG